MRGILHFHRPKGYWFLPKEWDHGWPAGWWGAIKFSAHWFLNPGYRSKGNIKWSLSWSWNMGWHLGRWYPL